MSLSLIQIGFIGLVEEEWLVTLATVDREEVTYLDFVTEGTKLAKELRDEVISPFAIMSFNMEGKSEMLLILYVVRCIRLGSCGYLLTNNDYPSLMITKLLN